MDAIIVALVVTICFISALLFGVLILYAFFKVEINNILAARKLKDREFVCSQCGKCCAFTVVVGDFDVHQLEKSGFDTGECVSKKLGVRHLTKIDGYCSFFKNNGCSGKKNCGIYDQRLYICRRFPYLTYAGFKAIDTRCPEVQRMLNL